jgi:hypothetical protein
MKSHLVAVTFLVLFGCAVSAPKQGAPQNNVPPQGDLSPYAKDPICQRTGNTAVTEAELDSEFAQARARNTEDAYRNFVFCHRANEKHYNEAVARLDEVLHPSTTTTGSSSSPSLGTSVQVENSQFESFVKFQGIEERYPGSEFNSYLLRSWVNKTNNQAKHQLYVSNYYNGSWTVWVNANSQDAQPLEFVSISRDVIFCGADTGCSYSEQFGATIPDTMLKTHQDGFSVKFYAKTGKEMVITLTSQQIRQQLKAIEAFQASNKK